MLSWKNDPSYIDGGTASAGSDPSHRVRFQHPGYCRHGLSVHPGPSVGITWKPRCAHAGRTGSVQGVGAAEGARVPIVMGARLTGGRVMIGGSVIGARVGAGGHGTPSAVHVVVPSPRLHRQLPSAQHR